MRSLQRLFLTEIGLRIGNVWVSDDLAAVAVWITPSSTGLDAAFGDIADQVTDLYGDRAEIAARPMRQPRVYGRRIMSGTWQRWVLRLPLRVGAWVELCSNPD